MDTQKKKENTKNFKYVNVYTFEERSIDKATNLDGKQVVEYLSKIILK